MRNLFRRPRDLGRWTAVLILAGLLVPGGSGAWAESKKKASRQVTVFGVVATPDRDTIDPKLESIAPQLRKLLPNHGFKLLDVQSKRLVPGQSVTCGLGGDYTAEATLDQPLDSNGKVRLQCKIFESGVIPIGAAEVATPPNQLFFFDKKLENGSRLLIGVGAR